MPSTVYQSSQMAVSRGDGMSEPRVLELSTQARPGGRQVVAIVKPPSPVPRGADLGWMTTAVRVFALLVIVAVCVLLLPASLSSAAKAALFAFALAVVLWSMTELAAAWAALLSVLVLIALGGAEQQELLESLSSDVVWLMIGAFILGSAVQSTGLAARLTGLVTRRARTVGGVFWMVTVVLLPLSAMVPSTSGRAAVMVPMYRSLSRAADDRRTARALALLIPTVILVSTVGTLVGAGSHLIANDLLDEATGERLSFARWALYGMPFALVASLLSCQVILWMFLDAKTRATPLGVTAGASRRSSRRFTAVEYRTVAVALTMVVLWTTEGVHGIAIATVAVAGAIVLTMPAVGVMSWKTGVKAVQWNLVVFVGAALVLGEALINTGAAQWIVARLFTLSGIAEAGSELFVLTALALLTLTSHLYMTSHAARAAALVPALVYLAQTLGLDPVAVMFIGTVGMDYCLTFPVSSKALLLYAEIDDDTFEPPDLLRLSAVLLPAHVTLIIVFYYGYWQFVGLTL